jgi:hypothetical protein
MALLLVALGVGYEFVADRVGAPLRRRIEEARKDELVRLGAQTAEANARAAEAAAKVEELRRENLALEARLAPRRLSPEDVSEFPSAAARHVGQKFKITWPIGDMEAAGFAVQLIRMLLAAGWLNVDNNQAMPRSYEGERILVGVRLLPGIDQKSKETADFLLDWLRSKRIGAWLVLPTEAPLPESPVDDVMEVRVGVKLSVVMDNARGIR